MLTAVTPATLPQVRGQPSLVGEVSLSFPTPIDTDRALLREKSLLISPLRSAATKTTDWSVPTRRLGASLRRAVRREADGSMRCGAALPREGAALRGELGSLSWAWQGCGTAGLR